MKTETETVAKPTPGPWALENHGINESEYGHGVVHSHGGAHRFVIIKGVGKLETVDMDIPKLEANAALIAAAPELLSALEEITERYAQLDRRLVAGQHSEPNGTISRAMAALAKAKGTP